MNTYFKLTIVTLGLAAVVGCDRVKDGAKDALNKAGDAAGQTAGEITKGIEKGIDKSREMVVQLSPALTEKGVSTGQSVIESDSSGNDNRLSAYFIFSKDFKGTLKATAYSNKQLEMGRSTATISATKGEAKYVEFIFDRRVNLDVDSKVTVE